MRLPRLADRFLVVILTALIHGYQLAVAPLFVGGCRHWPTCSQYAIEALRLHGARQGLLLSLHRLQRCRPHGTFGYDPVPRPPDRPLITERT